MTGPIACVAPGRRLAAAAAAELEIRRPGARVLSFSLREYLASAASPAAVVLCPAGRSLSEDLAFLRKVAGRALWPPPRASFRDAIGGLRTPNRQSGPTLRRAGEGDTQGPAAALLLEGTVGPERARAALRSSSPRDWIVESPRHVRLTEARLDALAREGVRWWALDPVEVVALYATPIFARARSRWRKLLPAGTAVWVRQKTEGGRRARSR